MNIVAILVAGLAMSASLRAQVLITEIMFDPIKGRGCEYVELFNPSATSVTLRNWRIVDGTGKSQAVLPRSATIAPDSYLLLAADSLVLLQFPGLADSIGSASKNIFILNRSSFGLNGDGDAVVLRDHSDNVVDSLWYLPDWHRPDLDSRDGTALERASMSAPSTRADNWTSSAGRNGGTPGAPNSVALHPRVVDAEITVHPSTVSPDADGYQDVTRITYRLPMRTARIVMSLHDRYGRLLERLMNNELTGSLGEFIWNAYDAHGMPRAPEIYIVRIEAYDAAGVGLVTAQTGVVVARR